jgi:hypothetical protein
MGSINFTKQLAHISKDKRIRRDNYKTKLMMTTAKKLSRRYWTSGTLRGTRALRGSQGGGGRGDFKGRTTRRIA